MRSRQFMACTDRETKKQQRIGWHPMKVSGFLKCVLVPLPPFPDFYHESTEFNLDFPFLILSYKRFPSQGGKPVTWCSCGKEFRSSLPWTLSELLWGRLAQCSSHSRNTAAPLSIILPNETGIWEKRREGRDWLLLTSLGSFPLPVHYTLSFLLAT